MRLPLSGIDVSFGEPDGAVEAAIAELPTGRPVAAGLALLRHLGRVNDGTALEAEALTMTDFETALAALRIHLLGANAASLVLCGNCGAQAELAFSFTALADDVSPRLLPGTVAAADGGEIAGTRFRLPTAGDVAACEAQAGAEDLLIERCTGHMLANPSRRRVERAIARMAPLLSRVVSAPCLACRATLRVLLHVPSFVVGEIAWSARTVFDEVHLIASAYGWREPEILALSAARRRRYAAAIRAGT